MMVKSLIVLIAFAMTLFTPFIVTIHTDADGNTVSLFTLDVCHASGSAMSAQADIPFLYESPCVLSISENNLIYEDSYTALLPFQAALQTERPPKV